MKPIRNLQENIWNRVPRPRAGHVDACPPPAHETSCYGEDQPLVRPAVCYDPAVAAPDLAALGGDAQAGSAAPATGALTESPAPGARPQVGSAAPATRAQAGSPVAIPAPGSEAQAPPMAAPDAEAVPGRTPATLVMEDDLVATPVPQGPPCLEQVQASPSPTGGLRKTTQGFLQATDLLRTAIQGARQGRPGFDSLLQAQSGHTLATVPPEGTLFIDPYFVGTDAQAALLAPGTPASRSSAPARAEDLLFADGRTLGLPGESAEGALRFTRLEDYQAFVAGQRSERLGRPDDGAPQLVHLSLSGGGGKGKRYVAAFEELYRLGIVPASVAGTSAGAITAALIAAGADPERLRSVLQDERFSQLLDTFGPGALAKGKVAYELFEDVLGDLTGIKDRPVTFADLRLPLTVVATKYADSAFPADAGEGLQRPEDRTFVFSLENTPHTPVALALRASMAIPAVFAPVEMVDPTTGRTITLVDGGLLENLPVGHGTQGLPEVALHPVARGYSTDKRLAFRMPKIPFPDCQLFAHNILQGAINGFRVFMGSQQAQREYESMTSPPKGTFVVNLPVWDVDDPSRANTLLSFQYDPEVDASLDRQTTNFIDAFFSEHLENLEQHGAAASNVKAAPGSLSFSRDFTYEGKTWHASYDGGRNIALTSEDGSERFILARPRQIENWLVEDASFGDLASKLHEAMQKRFGGIEAIVAGLPEDY